MKKKVISLRLDEETADLLDKIAETQYSTTSTLCQKVLKRYVAFFSKKEGRDITLGRDVIKFITNAMDPKEIDRASSLISDYIIAEIRIQEGHITLEILENRLEKWNQGNSMEFNKIETLNSIIYTSNHKMGEKWSECQGKTYQKLFQKMGVNDVDLSHSPESFTITINQ